MSMTDTTPTVDLATFTVNGTEVQAPKGANLLRTLLAAGYKIPHYCYHPALTVDGTCRLCFIQMEGDPRLHVSCNMKVGDGLKILTDTDTIREARQGMMEFLLVNHPLDCPVCDKGGECLLQRYSMDHGIGDARMEDQRRRYPKPQFDPLIDLERNRCILCSRCVRFCDEIAEDHVLGIVERGDRNRIASFGNGPISSIYSGNVIDLCPVGALTSKPFRFHARTWEMQQIVTSCVHCSTGCSMTAWARDGKIYRVTTPVVRKGDEYALNEDTTDFICNMGRFASDFGHSEQRLAKAQVRRDGKMVEVSSTEAVKAAAQLMKNTSEQYGPQSVAFIAGPRATNEEIYLLQKIARDGIQTNSIDWRLHLDSAEACAAHSAALAASDGTVEDIETSQCVLVVETDLSSSTPILALKVKEAAKHRKNQTILIGSVVDELVAKHAAQTLVRPLDQVVGLLEKAISEDSENGDAEVNALIQALHSASNGLIVMGLSEQSGMLLPALVPLVLKLKIALGPSWKLLAVPAERNGVGAFALGAQPDRLPGNRNAVDGLTAPEIIAAAAEGRIKALYVLGQDLLNLAPDAAGLAKALEKTEVLIVQDAFPGVASAKASVLIPSALFTEKDGSMLNADRAVSRLVKGYAPPQGIMSDLEALGLLANELGLALDSADAASVYESWMSQVQSDGQAGFEELLADQPGDEWPLRVDPLAEKSARPSVHVLHDAIEFSRPVSTLAQVKSPSGALNRWTWNVSRNDHLGNQSPTMSRLRPMARVSMNSETAGSLCFVDGQRIQVNAEGRDPVDAVVCVSENVARGVLHLAGNDFPAAMLKGVLNLSPA